MLSRTPALAYALGQLGALWDAVCAGSGRVASIEGIAGIGKSRLDNSLMNNGTV